MIMLQYHLVGKMVHMKYHQHDAQVKSRGEGTKRRLSCWAGLIYRL